MLGMAFKVFIHTVLESMLCVWLYLYLDLWQHQRDRPEYISIIDSKSDIKISFKESSLTVNESVGVLELRLVADKVVERELWINLSTQDDTAMSEMECYL